jgi:hypothetical protein
MAGRVFGNPRPTTWRYRRVYLSDSRILIGEEKRA